jgi:hypothetical protein
MPGSDWSAGLCRIHTSGHERPFSRDVRYGGFLRIADVEYDDGYSGSRPQAAAGLFSAKLSFAMLHMHYAY